MKKVIKYESTDGTVFETAEECKKYERLLKNIEKVMRYMRYPNDEPLLQMFLSGQTFIQQHEISFKKAKNELENLIENTISLPESIQNLSDEEIKFYINDSGFKCLEIAWSRICNVDSKFREWHKPEVSAQ